MPQQREMTPEQYAAMEPDKVLRIMQIIAGALMAGVVSFGVIDTMIVLNRQQPPLPVTDPSVLVGLFFGSVCVVVRFVIGSIISKSGVARIADIARAGTSTGAKELLGRLLGVAQTRMIVEDAMLEGAAFCNLVMFIISGSMVSATFVVVLIVLMAMNFPTRLKLGRWLEDQQRNLDH
ncbi:MAG: hypothetical protein IAG10_05410 [Planctomycetaceae bacterium]|nr:hypothetical protein [Planctomycetaceae bacterium]